MKNLSYVMAIVIMISVMWSNIGSAEGPTYFSMSPDGQTINPDDTSHTQIIDKDKPLWTTKEFVVKQSKGFYCIIYKDGNRSFTKDVYVQEYDGKFYIIAFGKRSELVE